MSTILETKILCPDKHRYINVGDNCRICPLSGGVTCYYVKCGYYESEEE